MRTSIYLKRLEEEAGSPWTGYGIFKDDELVGQCAFKSPPVDGRVEIAYYVFGPFEGQGIGTVVCRLLVEIARQTDQNVRITARTLMSESASTRILRRNGFHLVGTVVDPEDGDVWEWEYRD